MNEANNYLAAFSEVTVEPIKSSINKILEGINKCEIINNKPCIIRFYELEKLSNDSNRIETKLLLKAIAMSNYSINLLPLGALTDFDFSFYASRMARYMV